MDGQIDETHPATGSRSGSRSASRSDSRSYPPGTIEGLWLDVSCTTNDVERFVVDKIFGKGSWDDLFNSLGMRRASDICAEFRDTGRLPKD